MNLCSAACFSKYQKGRHYLLPNKTDKQVPSLTSDGWKQHAVYTNSRGKFQIFVFRELRCRPEYLWRCWQYQVDTQYIRCGTANRKIHIPYRTVHIKSLQWLLRAASVCITVLRIVDEDCFGCCRKTNVTCLFTTFRTFFIFIYNCWLWVTCSESLPVWVLLLGLLLHSSPIGGESYGFWCALNVCGIHIRCILVLFSL